MMNHSTKNRGCAAIAPSSTAEAPARRTVLMLVSAECSRKAISDGLIRLEDARSFSTRLSGCRRGASW